MIYYIILLLITIIYIYIYEKYNNKILLLLPLLFMALFSGLRYDAGNDYFTYLDIIRTGIGLERLELLNRIIIDLGYYFNNHYLYFFVTSFIITFSIGIYCIRDSQYPGYAILLFLLLPLSYLTSFGYVRQYLAISLFVLSVSFFMERRLTFSFLLFFLASISHSSALLFIWVFPVAFFINKRIYSVSFYFFILILFYLFGEFVLIISKHFDIYSYYLSEDNMLSNGKNMWFACFIIFIFLLMNRRTLTRKIDIAYFNLFFLFVAIYLALINTGEYVIRVVYFLFPFSYVCISQILGVNSRYAIFKRGFIIAFAMTMFLITLYLAYKNPTRDFLTNYQFNFII
ncbi:EpsG family protein [Aeromonas hydrophila]|uniref:EpsG family protein n=1 Tax=Aeromonas TaxID=642 RepID=UPI001F539F97|nr:MULTISPECIES: EpsG family protein [Aeromonas]UUT61294.1 EpsG family protein [Aeromonas hydrophila]